MPSVAAAARNSTVPSPIRSRVVPVLQACRLSVRAADTGASDGIPGSPVDCGTATSVVLGGVAEAGAPLGRPAWGWMTVYVARTDASLVTVMVCGLLPRYRPGGGVARSVATQVLPDRVGVARASVEPSQSNVIWLGTHVFVWLRPLPASQR